MTANPSDTPKTDAVAFYVTNDRVRRESVFADFARGLERRITELDGYNVGLAQDIEDLKKECGQSYWRRMAMRAEQSLANALAEIDALEERLPPPPQPAQINPDRLCRECGTLYAQWHVCRGGLANE